MGRKKKFIDKKNSATFHLLARDSSSFSSTAADRVFVRVDNNPFPVHPGLLDEFHGDHGDDADAEGSSIFADAPGDAEDASPVPWSSAAAAAAAAVPSRGGLPENVRRDILELGLPDDGYNYLVHLREINGAGGGSAYFDNPRAKLDRVPLDVKAYDASRVRISGDACEDEESNRDSLYAVASKTAAVKVQRAVDPDVAKLLDDDDLSRFGSDVEDLEEDFVIKANCPEEEEDEVEEEEEEENRELFRSDRRYDAKKEEGFERGNGDSELEDGAKQRVRRLLDEQFDMLTLREYDNDSDNDDAGYIEEEHESLANKLKDALKEYVTEDLELDDKYRVPADFKHGQQESGEVAKLDASADVIRRCAEYAEKYLNESEDDKEVVLVEESSDESEVWDCETIVSTFSNLDNHPGKIQAPGNPKKRFPKVFSRDSTVKHDMITLRGKEMLPVDYLPQKKKHTESAKKENTLVTSSSEKPKRRVHTGESKEEKKERKAAVKEERREARKTKKELKGLYKCEAQKAQKVIAVAGPSSIHLM
ncbi:uncharacterized protein [Typha latifolia]|uniref:uncharacterized protein n=1 Tax=Typha latifolia TaxID=4733 RepID=UPI003C2FBFB9